MNRKLSFEMQLLGQMSADYRTSVLRDLGITEKHAKRLSDRSPLGFPFPTGPDADVAMYRDVLGPEVSSDVVGYRMTEDLAESSTAHCFVLGLWPHLFWVVHVHSESGPWDLGFQNQTVITTMSEFDPSVIRTGLWTLRALEGLADDYKFHDGWEQNSVLQFRFGDRRFEGAFTWNLLDEWREL